MNVYDIHICMFWHIFIIMSPKLYIIRHICMCTLMHMHKKQACTDTSHFVYMMCKIKKRINPCFEDFLDHFCGS